MKLLRSLWGSPTALLSVALTLAFAANYLTYTTLTATKAELSAEQTRTSVLREGLAHLSTALTQKDEAIKLQSEGAQALADAAKASRAAYEAANAAARSTAQTHKAASELLIHLDPPAGDELAQCRAARDLLAKELTQ